MGMVRMQFTSNDAQAVRSFMKLENRTDALKRKQQRLRQQSGKTNKSSQQGASKWAKRLTAVAAGYMGIHAALGQAKKMMREYRQEKERAAEASQEQFKGFSDLGQIATDRQHLQQMIKDSRKTMVEARMSEEEAGQLQFLLESTGRSDKREMYAGLAEIADPTKMAKSVSTIQNALGVEETGEDRAVIDKLFEASSIAKTTVTEIAGGATRAAQQAKGVGTSDEELLAAIAATSRGEVNVERVSTRIGAMADFADQSDLIEAEDGLMGIVEAAQKLEKEGQADKDIFTNKRALQGYRLMKANMEDIAELQDKVQKTGEAAEATDTTFGALAGQRVQMVRQKFGEEIMAERQKIKRKLGNEERRGESELVSQGIIDTFAEEQDDAGYNFVTRYGRLGELKAARAAGASNQTLMSMIHHYDPKLAKKVASEMGYSKAGRSMLMGQHYAGGGEFEALQIDAPNVNNQTNGMEAEVNVTMKDKRSNQQSRTGGAAGVE